MGTRWQRRLPLLLVVLSLVAVAVAIGLVVAERL